MAIILFLVDNSLSTAQKTPKGNSYLDTEKIAVETILKERSRDQAYLRDRYMLFTLDPPPTNVKVGWHENMSTFSDRLNAIRPTGLTSLGIALKYALDVLNLNRLSTGMDTFGQGYFPFFMETSMVIILTDYCKLTSPCGIHNELLLPMNNTCMGFELTEEPFSWDQRIFSFVFDLRNQNPKVNHNPYANQSPTHAMCEVTGGRSYLITSQKSLQQAVEMLVSKITSGVVVRFEHYKNNASADSTLIWQTVRRMIRYIGNNKALKCTGKAVITGNWPIPERYWPTSELTSIPQRSAQPVIYFSSTANHAIEEPIASYLLEDCYELENSTLTRYILEKNNDNAVYQVFIKGSFRDPQSFGYPFGFLKSNSYLQTVNLHILPYNYPDLSVLLQELENIPLLSKPSEHWLQRFQQYISTVPGYYYLGLRKILNRRGLSSICPDVPAFSLNNVLQNYLRKIRADAKAEFENIRGCDNPLPVTDLPLSNWKPDEVCYSLHFSIGMKECAFVNDIAEQFHIYKRSLQYDLTNKWIFDRNSIMSTYTELKWYLNHPGSVDYTSDESRHSTPIQQMGDFQSYINMQPAPLREIELLPVRQNIFGNPFKTTKQIDECDDLVGNQADNESSSRRSLSDGSIVLAEKRRKWFEFLKSTDCWKRGSTMDKCDTSKQQFDAAFKYIEDDEPMEIVLHDDISTSEDTSDRLSVESTYLKSEYDHEMLVEVDDDELSILVEESSTSKDSTGDFNKNNVIADLTLIEDSSISSDGSSLSSGRDSSESDEGSCISSDEEFWIDYEASGKELPWWTNDELIDRYYNLKMECFKIIRSRKQEQKDLFRYLYNHVRLQLPAGSALSLIEDLKEQAIQWKSAWIASKLDLVGVRVLLAPTALSDTNVCETVEINSEDDS